MDQKYIVDILEAETQDYFENIAEQIARKTDKVIDSERAQVIRATLGPITFNQFVSYINDNTEFEVEFTQ